MTVPIMIHGDNFAYFTAIEEQTTCNLGNWWYITSKSYQHVVHFLNHELKPLCGAELRGNHLIPDTTRALSSLKIWMKGSRCMRCMKILESRKKNAERETMKALRKAGFQIQLADIDYLDDDGYLPLCIIVYAPVKGLAKKED